MKEINETTEEEVEGEAYRMVENFSFEVFDIYKNNALFRNANRGKVWTFWNALVFCGTIYTTMGKFLLPQIDEVYVCYSGLKV